MFSDFKDYDALPVEDFRTLLAYIVQQFENAYDLLSSINIAGVSLFLWLLGFAAVGMILTVISSFASVGDVSIPGVSTGISESIRQDRAERADTLLKAHNQTEQYYQSLLRRNKNNK